MELFMGILALLLLGGCFVALIFIFLYLWSLSITRAPFIAIPGEVVHEIIQALDLTSQSVLYDLGSGEGRVLIAAAKATPSARFVGIDNAILPTMLAKLKVRRAKLQSRIKILKANFFKRNLDDATHVFCYLYPAVMADLEPKFQKELKKGTRVVSCDFQMPNKAPSKVIELRRPNKLGQKLFVYEY